jgi:NAD(P)-dependent dehydrogenase (short-subunit alcohol dehydrogenase family)
MQNPFDLRGQVAVITGSSKGIGRAAAEIMAALGAKVVISSRKADVCEEVAAGIRKAGGEAITIATWGKIDTLVCNAAVNPYFGPLAGISEDAFDKIMSSNIKSNLWLCNLALPHMVEQGGGSVVIVSSIGGLRGSAQLGAYGISKAADMQLTRSLAVEWSPKGVRINCVAPGLVKTDFARALWEDPERLKRTVSTAPLRRIGEPDEIGSVIAFLASKASSFMTGTVVIADGGVTIA